MVITAVANTAVGDQALINNTGESNTATGFASLFENTSGSNNTANGAFALSFNTVGERNVAIGDGALESNTTGTRHTAVGFQTLQNCIAAPDFAGNTAIRVLKRSSAIPPVTSIRQSVMPQ